jgi:uncharacterized membrane protein YciS (DUF1049 family)
MKKIIAYLLILLMLPLAFASIDSTAECEKKSCVEGSIVHWTVPVVNNINKTIIIEYIRIVDANSISMAYYDAEKNKTLAPGENYTYEFDTLITAPLSGYTWYYKPCMRITVEGGSESQFVCGGAVKSFSVLPISKTGCLLDSDCPINEVCDDYTMKCVSLGCENGNAVKGNACVAESGLMSGKVKTILIIAAVIIICILLALFLSKRKAKEATQKNKRHKKKAKKQRK